MSIYYIKWKGHYWEVHTNPFGDFGVLKHPDAYPYINYLPLSQEECSQVFIDEFIPRAEKVLAGGVDLEITSLIIKDPFQ